MAISTRSASLRPTYGELIDLFEETERKSPNDEEILFSEFKKLYPMIHVGRPKRFYEIISCIVAPTKRSLIGKPKLALASYRKRTWEPRIRNMSILGAVY